MKSVGNFTIAAMAVAAALLLWAAGPSEAQLIVVDQRYWVAELKPDERAIGVSYDNDYRVDRWVYIDGDTDIATNMYRPGGLASVMIPPREVWEWLKPGMRIKVHGGRRFDYNVNAKKIWF